ncbi:NAD(P)H nitroreductase [Oceanibacterium hippocampi]|uniref:Putative NAD(P)H nitroreductase n=1 Tax=Oceanibacterium hippocampi TaxID=745714 RepID=A0A1Y5TXD1_9PROT|nr:NAD(P)H nitroreductase [Oceanibacterium hippocampi]SLN74786.1 Putative NAD(P)H nitroreductase YdjA [Oceanibacterium hippocampi]
MDAITALMTRASHSRLTEPGPDDDALSTILGAAMTAPDHGRLRPWRFLVFRGEGLVRLGDIFAEAHAARDPDALPAAVEKARGKPLRAPVVIAVIAKVQENGKIPAVEQVLSAGAAAQNMLLAAHALGWGAMWRTGAPAYDETVRRALSVNGAEAIVGYLYLGTPKGEAAPERPDPAEFVEYWTGA